MKTLRYSLLFLGTYLAFALTSPVASGFSKAIRKAVQRAKAKAAACDAIARSINPRQPRIPLIHQQPNPDRMNALLQRFRPVFYLHHEEKYFPISVESYFAGTTTSVIDKDTKRTLIAPGHTTILGLYRMFQQKGNQQPKIYVQNHACVQYGVRPRPGHQPPIYGAAFQRGGRWYLQYTIFWGYNGTYPLAFLGFTASRIKIGGQHWGDLEHVTLRLNPSRTHIDQLYFAAHGSTDGMTLPRHMIQFEGGGVRPVIYSAVNGHGSYPRTGIYIRLASAASDVTGRSLRWDPPVSRIFGFRDRHFRPDTMGWIYSPGYLGPDGIDGLGYKDWFLHQAITKPSPRAVPCTYGRDCATMERPAFGPLANWCPSASDKLCILRKMGTSGVWKPIADEIRKEVLNPAAKGIRKGAGYVAKGGRYVGRGVVKGGRTVGRGVVKGGKAVGKGAKKVGKKIKKLFGG